MSGLRRYMIFGAILLIVYLVAQFTKPKPIDWTTTFLPQDKNPYGTYVLRHQLQDLFPKASQQTFSTDLSSTLTAAPKSSSNYIIVAGTVSVNAAEFKAMKEYMKAGNHIFIAAFQLGGVLEDSLKISLNTDFDLGGRKKYPINFTSPHIKRELDYYFDRRIAAQYFINLDTAKAVVLGRKYEKYANLLQYRFGKGGLLLCPNPQLFTNYSLLNENGADYAARAFSYLPQADNILWDDYFARPATGGKSPLRVLFSYDQLRWAYYIALAGLVIFVLYEMKRRQRIIPIVDPLTNTSVEFAKVVGRVYYQQRNHYDIIDKKINYFLEYLRNKYRLKTTVLDQEFVQTVVNITGINQDLIDQIVNFINSFHQLDKKTKAKDQYLIEFNKLIEQFYKLDR